MRNIFLNSQSALRSGWWIAIFFSLLAALLFPFILLGNGDVPIFLQALLVLVVSLTCQLLRRKPPSDLFGVFDSRWLGQLFVGMAGGAVLMLTPALVLAGAGAVSWSVNAGGAATLAAGVALFAAVAATEELLFRGFVFQRLLDGIGEWPAQLLIAAFFLLTHSDALRASGSLGYLAGLNIFLASIMFGLAFIRTRSLAMLLGLHFAANVTQGSILGFGVSGDDTGGLLVPSFVGGPDWLTGGTFGLEASVPGLVCVIALTGALWLWRPTK